MAMETKYLNKISNITAIFAFLLSSAVTAAPLGFYGGLQLLATKIDQEGLERSDVAGDTNSVFSSRTTFPVGTSTYSSLTVNSQTINSFKPSESNDPFGARFFVGYTFMPFFGLEGGFTGLQKVTREYTANTNTTLNGFLVGPGSFTQNGATVKREDSATIFILDMAVKAIYPFRDRFEIFGKIGYTMIWEQFESQREFTFTSPTAATFSYTEKRSNRRTAPLIGIGASYYLGPLSSIDFAWTRIVPHASDPDSDEQHDFFSIGVTFYRGDFFC